MEMAHWNELVCKKIFVITTSYCLWGWLKSESKHVSGLIIIKVNHIGLHKNYYVWLLLPCCIQPFCNQKIVVNLFFVQSCIEKKINKF